VVVAKQVINFVVNTEADRDILRWLDQQTNRSAAIRAAIRAQLGGGISLGDVFQAIKAVERKLERGAIVVAPASHRSGPDDWDEPPDAAAALDALANL